MAVITDIADAVVAELNATSFSQAFTAERAYLPVFELADLKNVRVTVVPKGVSITPGNRSNNQHDCAIDVAVQKKLDAADNAEIDALVSLVDEIGDHFRFRRLDSYPNAVWTRTENEPVYSQEHLDQFRQFTGLLTLTFRVMR